MNILSNSQNPKEILKEFELINQRAISYSNSNLISKNRNYSDENLFNQLTQINLNFVEIQKENQELKNLIKEKIIGFEDVKNSIKNVQDEINKIKNSKDEKENKLKKNFNKKNLTLKDIKLNNIQKVNGIEEIKNEKDNLSESIDSINKIQPNENVQKKNNPEFKLNFNGLEEYKNSFNELFLSNYNEFSASWRKDADKIMGRINNNM